MPSFPLPSAIQAAYLQFLKSIKPSLNINDANSDFVIRGKAASGVVSGLYGDQSKVYKDTFTTTARPEALLLKGQDLGLSLQKATVSSSNGVTITGPNGTSIAAGALTFLYVPTGLFYSNTTGGTIANGVLTLTVQSQAAGSNTNVATPDSLTVVSPPTGVGTVASIVTSISGGSDIETYDSFRARILARQQYTPAGGTAADYKAWAFAGDPSVRSATVQRFIKGYGTVGVIITSGVTDVDSAVTQGIPVVRVPSAQVIANVQAYVDSVNPLTDCATIFAPSETQVSVSVAVDLAPGLTLASVPSSAAYNPLGLTVQGLVAREVSRALYKFAIGGRSLNGSTQGYIVASDIELNLDYWLSAATDPATGLTKGLIPILTDRQVLPLNGTSYDLPIAANSLAAPGIISVSNGVT